MTTNYQAEFKTVDLILASDAVTRGVDAFALCLIKCERQLRRLVTYLVFQSPAFAIEHVEALRRALLNSNRVYFEGFEKGFDTLYSRTVRELIGPQYPAIRVRLTEATQYRNKIFHGQLSAESLSREQLIQLVTTIRDWCERLANSAQEEIGYDGFGRDSFRKSDKPHFSDHLKIRFENVEAYATFIRDYLERAR